MVSLKVSALNEKYSKIWDFNVCQSTNSEPYHKYSWLKYLEFKSKTKLYLIYVKFNGKIICLFPIFVSNFASLNLIFSPPPYLGIPYLGPIFLNIEKYSQSKQEDLISQSFLQTNKLFVEKFKPVYYQYLFTPKIYDIRSFSQENFSIFPRYTYTIPMESAERNMERLSPSVRREIRKANRKGITFREGDLNDLLHIRRLTERRYNEQGVHYPFNEEYMKNLWKNNDHNSIKVFLAEIKNKILNGIIVTFFNGKVSFLSGLPKQYNSNVHINNWIHWKIIEWSIKNSVNEYDLIGANVVRLSNFKKKLGPNPKLYFMISKFLGVGYLLILANRVIKKVNGTT